MADLGSKPDLTAKSRNDGAGDVESETRALGIALCGASGAEKFLEDVALGLLGNAHALVLDLPLRALRADRGDTYEDLASFRRIPNRIIHQVLYNHLYLFAVPAHARKPARGDILDLDVRRCGKGVDRTDDFLSNDAEFNLIMTEE